MLAYQFYCMGEDGKDDLIAILPERRRNPERITDRSILNWATEVIGNGCNGQSIYFVEVNHTAMESRPSSRWIGALDWTEGTSTPPHLPPLSTCNQVSDE